MPTTIIAGDSLTLTYSHCDADLSEGWSCSVSIAVLPTSEPLLTLAFTDLIEDDTAFTGTLSSATTATLAPGVYFVIGRIYNADGQSKEFQDRLLVRQRVGAA